jgi:DNA invertase Pin-like site-specific DNA recombinase
LAKLIRRLKSGDVLVVTRLDRLARSTRDLLNILDVIGKAGAGFKSLSDAWADTTTPHGRLMLTVLGGLAEFERELIRARTGDGRARAKARGVKFGRPAKLSKSSHSIDPAELPTPMPFTTGSLRGHARPVLGQRTMEFTS